jgi:LDH2 family malate/lactate/ureidoglycolate dehydrogenase
MHEDRLTFPAAKVEAQISAILTAWGMAEEEALVTSARMVEADLRGIDSHGIFMLPAYDEWRRKGMLNMSAKTTVVRETGGTALLDADGGLGHDSATRAAHMAIEKAQAHGVSVVTVRNSQHYGAAGVYAIMAAEAGLIGMSCSTVWKAAVVPTHACEPMFGTNPLAFAAPAERNPPFVLDMATSTVAIGKLKLARQAGVNIPAGWALGPEGQIVTDPGEALVHRLLTPLGGYKGYGLAAMVEILSAALPGAMLSPLRKFGGPRADRDVGHFFMAIDPASFQDPLEFRQEVDAMIDALHTADRSVPVQPVLVAGDPEHEAERARSQRGIPLPASFLMEIDRLSAAAGASNILTQAA